MRSPILWELLWRAARDPAFFSVWLLLVLMSITGFVATYLPRQRMVRFGVVALAPAIVLLILLCRPSPDAVLTLRPEVDTPLRRWFGRQVLLLGYGIDDTTDGRLGLTLYWWAKQPVPQNWTVFTHLLDKDGVVRAQHDSIPNEGRSPTAKWQVDQLVIDHHAIPLRQDLPAGDYTIELGFYQPTTGERMPAYDASGPLEQNRVVLPVVCHVARIRAKCSRSPQR